ncbi:phosphoadenosine phosphosulfate reductase family protein [Xenorhabdus bovienii]|uniref:phosphoadenosine phosphosulfate reductase domain-containing protein n=2 Tax=Xenorhabdus bovienii TaxID=40576 RepID=UPI0023B2D8FA|nr:phosphoadenosine phosphosulfate reductase family protein [Xenorhabdus bovienii]MDE9459322.1 phosphoadenosine phosphosulfate reductase family protein [Xenorhabdus bovienii]MDE9515515.1 phosphoadenosine phosphosulfate reductase family protein [Xenorhabdus bovienii]
MIDIRCHAENTINVISVSGGKDSLAQWLLAREANVPHITVFADTGHEHPQTLDYLDYLEHRLGKIQRVKADFVSQIKNKREFIKTRWPISLVEECGMSPDQAEKRIIAALKVLFPTDNPFLDLCMLKGRFPSTKARFCTFELKHKPIAEQVIHPLLSQFDEVISWQGVRAQESPERAKLPEWESDVNDVAGLSVYRPIHAWTHEQVFALAKKHGIKPNPLYQQGCSRVGCMPCIHARKSELAEIYTRFPDEIARVARWERMVAACSRRGNSTFFPSHQDPVKRERRIEFVSLESHGIETYRDWALTSRGGRQFDLLAEENAHQACSSVYAGVCE